MIHDVVYLLKCDLAGAAPETMSHVFRQAGRALVAALKMAWRSPVVLKPNIVWREAGDSGIVTHPAFVGGLVDGMLAQGVSPQDIIVAEGGGVEEDHDMEQFFATAGYVAELAPRGVTLRGLNDDVPVVVPLPEGRVLHELHVAKTIADVLHPAEAGTLINVPKMKTHNFATVTLSVKNMQGMLTPLGHRHLCTLYPRYEGDDGQGLDPRVLDKADRFYQKLVDLALGIRPNLHIIEGVVGRDGTGFHRGKNIPMGLVLAGTNPFAVDQVGAMLMGFAPQDVGFLRVAAERKLWVLDASRIQVLTLREDAWVSCPDWLRYRADPPFELIRREGLIYDDA